MRSPSLIDYGFNIYEPAYEELFTPKKVANVKPEEEKKQTK